jgi:hypothetical protein
MRVNEKVQHPSCPLAPGLAVLNYQHLIDAMNPKDQKKYYNTGVKFAFHRFIYV